MKMKRRKRCEMLTRQLYWFIRRRLDGVEDLLLEWAKKEGLQGKKYSVDTFIKFSACVYLSKRKRKKHEKRKERRKK